MVAAAAVGTGGRAQRRRRAARRRRLRAVRLLRVRHRHAHVRSARRRRPALQQLPHDGAVLADARLPADRAQPPSQRHGPHRRVRSGLPRLRRDHPEGERVPLRDPRAQRLRHVRGRQVAPRAGGRDGRTEGPAIGGRSVEGFERFYGFLGGETDQYHPDLVHDNHQIDPPRTPEDGYHLTEDLADMAIASSSRTSAPCRRRSRSSSTSRRAPATRRTRRRSDVHRPLPGRVRPRVGTRAATRSSRARWRPGCCPRAPS